MKRIAKVVALSVVALIGLVPIAATPAAAAGTLDVVITSPGLTNPEVAVGITNHWFQLTATNSAPAPADGTVIAFDRDGDFMDDETCETVAGVCSVFLTSSAEATEEEIRAWVVDSGAIPCNPLPIPMTDCDGMEGQDEVADDGGFAEPDDTDVVSLEWADGFLNVEKETTPTGPSTAVTLTATVLEEVTGTATPRGLISNVDAEIIDGPQKNLTPSAPDKECDTAQATGVCTWTYTPGVTAGVDKWQSWVDENENDPGDASATPPVPAGGDETTGNGFEADNTEGRDEVGTPGATPETDITDVVEVTISASPQLQVSPSTQTKNTGESASFTATVTLNGTGQNAQKVAMTVYSGPNNTKTASCNTGPAGTCTLQYTGGATAGNDKGRFWVDTNGNGQIDEGDATEDVNVPGATPEPDTTAIAQVTWVAPPPPPPPPDDEACQQAKNNLKKAKKALKKAKAKGDDEAIAKAKKKVKKAKKRKRAACA